MSCSPLNHVLGSDCSHHIMHMEGHIAQAGSHYDDHNTDGIDSCYYLDN